MIHGSKNVEKHCSNRNVYLQTAETVRTSHGAAVHWRLMLSWLFDWLTCYFHKIFFAMAVCISHVKNGAKKKWHG